ncbi:MAG: SAM-dependent methyltransferase [Patescibacteria group bacterium]|jgi:SAM-dependent methyltransferase
METGKKDTQSTESGNTGINDLIFKELIKRGCALEDGKKVWNIADSKLWYLTPEQAKGYLDLDKDNEYKNQIGQRHHEDLVAQYAHELIDMIGDDNVNIIDLGCGDGIKGKKIIDLIKSKIPGKIRYCPIDISGYLVEKAIETFSNADIKEVVEFQYNISDFENLENITPLLRKGKFQKNVILLFGNTLGNFEINEFLYEIRSSMRHNDIFIVDAAINDNKQSERAKSYANNKNFYKFLVHIPLQIGLDAKDVKFQARFRNKRIEIYFTLLSDKKISFQDKKILFKKEEKIIVAVAYKYEKSELLTFLNMHFGQVHQHCSEDKSKILAFCKK